MSLKDLIKAQVAALDAWARPWAERSAWNGWAYEFLLFGLKQAWACLFGGAMIVLLVGTHLLWPDDAPIARYDFLVIASVAIQALLLATKLERWDEALVILIFHAVGTIMEIFKTAQGSWIYPEESFLRIGGVPLFSGFMYACIGSYIARATRLFELKQINYPPLWTTWLLALLAYVNFFTHHYTIDIRLGCSRSPRSSSAAPGSCSRRIVSRGGCRCWWATCWWRCSSGLPRTPARSRRPGSIPASVMGGTWCRSRRWAPGIC
jgi:uncharacterized membrane protein YgdD (TMEM256/DUF423 family)